MGGLGITFLVRLAGPITPAHGMSREALDAYGDQLFAYIEQTAPQRHSRNSWIERERGKAAPWGGEGDDVVFGGLNPAFPSLLKEWSQMPLEMAYSTLEGPRGPVSGERGRAADGLPRTRADLDLIWADPNDRIIAKDEAGEGSTAGEDRAEEEEDGEGDEGEDEGDLRAEALALARGDSHFDSGFFSIDHMSAKVTPSEITEILRDPSGWALVFAVIAF